MKNKSRITKMLLTGLVLVLVTLLGACNRPVPTPKDASPTLAVPISTMIIQTETSEAEAANDIEVIETEEAMEEPTQAPTATKKATATPEPTEEPVPDISVPQSYTLQKDEFPYCIARRFDVNVGTLMTLNGLTSGQSYYEGMVLKIPQDSSWDVASHGSRTLRTHPVTYTVAAGDSIYSIACKFGDVSPEQIAAKNGLEAPYSLTPGMQLDIP